MPTVTPVLSEYITLNDMESTSTESHYFTYSFLPKPYALPGSGEEVARLRGRGSSAPGSRLFGSGEKSVP